MKLSNDVEKYEVTKMGQNYLFFYGVLSPSQFKDSIFGDKMRSRLI